MAEPKLPDGLDELLIEICEMLKQHEEALNRLLSEAEGLKATLTGADYQRFDPEREKSLQRHASTLTARIRSLDAIVERLRGT